MISFTRAALYPLDGAATKSLSLSLKNEDAVLAVVLASCGLSLRPLSLITALERRYKHQLSKGSTLTDLDLQ